MSSELIMNTRKCTLCNSGDIEDKYYVSDVYKVYRCLKKVCKSILPWKTKYGDLFRTTCIVLNIKSDREGYKLMPVNLVLKQYEKDQ